MNNAESNHSTRTLADIATEMKQELKEFLAALGFNVLDVGTQSAVPVDYPDYAQAVALAVARGSCDLGIMIDGAGIGSCWKRVAAPGGTQTRLACRRHPSKLPEDGSCSTTECGTRPRGVYIA